MSKIINFEEGWGFIQQGIKKLKNNLEGFEGFHETPQFTADDYSLLYTTIYRMCSQKLPHDYSMILYDKYKEVFEEYIKSTIEKAGSRRNIEGVQHVKKWIYRCKDLNPGDSLEPLSHKSGSATDHKSEM